MPRRWPLKLPKVETTTDIVTAIGATLDAVAIGDITPGGGTTIAGLLETKCKAIETEDIEQRIVALEGRK